MKPIILGNGLLGQELFKQTGWDILSRSVNNVDLTDITTWAHLLLPYNTVINCISFTNTYSDDKQSNWDVNYKAVIELTDYCNYHQKKLIHISTDYIYSNSLSEASEEDVPAHNNTWYSYTKLLGDAYVQVKSKNYLICRESHKPYPFPYPQAWDDVKTNGDLVPKIAQLIIKLIENDAKGVFNVGTEVKTIFDMASEFNIGSIKSPSYIPKDTTMNVSKLTNFLNNI